MQIFVEKILYKEVKRISSRIEDTSHLLDINNDNLNHSVLSKNYVLVSFDVVNMFLCIDNESTIKAVEQVLWNTKYFHVTHILEYHMFLFLV